MSAILSFSEDFSDDILCSLLGIILRDSHGVAQVRFVNGNKVLRIMKAVGLKPDIPEVNLLKIQN